MATKATVKKQNKKQQLTKPTTKSKNYLLYALPITLAVILYIYAKEFNFIQDDSYITYRYVKNFTEGNGLVFNIGERVEGYTNFLWVIILSFFKILSFDFISLSQVLGILASMLTVFFTYKLSSEIFPKTTDDFKAAIMNSLGALLVTANGAFAYWAVSGMETGLFCFLVILAVYLYLKELRQNKNYYSSLVFLLAALTRPEGVLFFVITIGHKIYHTLIIKKDNSSVLYSKENLKWLALFLVPGLIYMTWRLIYFGHLLPNTFYAKTGSSLEYFKTGFEYFWEFTKTYGLYGILSLITLYNFAIKEQRSERIYLLSMMLIFSLYVIAVGGDVLRPSRFFLPILPIMAILIQEGLISLSIRFISRKNSAAIWLIPTAAILISSYFIYKNQFDTIKRYSELENGLTEKMKITGTWMKNKQIQEGRRITVAATTIGAISYFSETTLIDMLGLTDAEIAHNPKPIPEISENAEIGWKERQYNVDYVLSRKPDYIYFSTGMKPSAYAERGLFTHDEFLKYYYPYYFTLKEYNFTETIYKRKSEQEAALWKKTENPNYKKSFVNLFNQAINTSRDKSKSNEALELFRKTIEAGPGNFSPPYQLMGEIYIQQRNNDKAIESFKKAIELDDHNIMAHVALYQIYVQDGDTLNARISLEKLSKYSPELLGN